MTYQEAVSGQTILTGDRPTGALHLGHLVGSLRSRVKLQETHKQYILVADVQALTDNATDPQKISRNVREVVIDYLAVGIDPSKSTVVLQSAVPELAELTQYFLNLVSVTRLSRNPTVKMEIQQKGFNRSLPAGFLTYPVSQAADILAFKATHVPVGNDQLPMIEQTNEIARRFNQIYDVPLFTEVEAIVPRVGRLPGIDGQSKMSKSLNNSLHLSASANDIRAAVYAMYTDPQHIRVSDPGQIEGNVVFTYLDAFHPDDTLVEDLKVRYQRGGLGDMEVKRILEEVLQETLAPIRARRAEIASQPDSVMDILRRGTAVARKLTASTLDDVKAAMGLIDLKNGTKQWSKR